MDAADGSGVLARLAQAIVDAFRDAMSTINQQSKLIATWLNDMTRCSELTNLSDRILQDIGLSRCYTRVEACKPFWMA
jgi:uncharacterized protein YjiS (DUF1127 family)